MDRLTIVNLTLYLVHCITIQEFLLENFFIIDRFEPATFGMIDQHLFYVVGAITVLIRLGLSWSWDLGLIKVRLMLMLNCP